MSEIQIGTILRGKFKVSALDGQGRPSELEVLQQFQGEPLNGIDPKTREATGLISQAILATAAKRAGVSSGISDKIFVRYDEPRGQDYDHH